jgi:AcrR family transcriptional regulator
VRLVQYYFGTKDQLLTDTLAFVGAEVAARIASRLTALGPDPAPRMMLDAIFDEFLPVDATRRAAMLVCIAFRTVALTDERLASSNRLGLGPALLAEIEAVIDRATTGRDNPTIDPASEAVVLVGTMTAVANGVLAGDITAPDARRHLRYALDRTFGTMPTDH